MNFDMKTVQVLKNFTTINPSLLFEPGNVLRTISPARTIMARATVDLDIDREFAIYDLSQLLATLALFEQTEVIAQENYLEIVSGSEKVKYLYADPSLIVTPPNKSLELPSVDVTFDLPADVLNKTMKAMSIMGAPELAVVGDGNDIRVQTYNSKNTNTSNYSNVVGKTDKRFTMVFLAENLKLMPGDYTVSISSAKIGHFRGSGIEYYVAVEQSSTMED